MRHAPLWRARATARRARPAAPGERGTDATGTARTAWLLGGGIIQYGFECRTSSAATP